VSGILLVRSSSRASTVVGQQRGWLDADADLAAADYLRGVQLAPTEGDQAQPPRRTVRLDGVTVLDSRQAGSWGVDLSFRNQPRQLVPLKWEWIVRQSSRRLH
jgi:hypothetical protein